ncbi:hypothetical protein CNMCM5793_006494 [Aspergillus hiratsukae]|uniref:Peptidase S8/S53 domain-containing protein n=1 Tax=Aspergillus hiratsukae TaxID=1194566 RepID=A0A8H6QGN0_9EURO|nr:hypothetical protein CNMCM5793_006494 [Aspergillus hiratsukae]KAF7173295.1 hypothetical protein CNMCM6106_007410 [Aspergillus hiratsukae]
MSSDESDYEGYGPESNSVIDIGESYPEAPEADEASTETQIDDKPHRDKVDNVNKYCSHLLWQDTPSVSKQEDLYKEFGKHVAPMQRTPYSHSVGDCNALYIIAKMAHGRHGYLKWTVTHLARTYPTLLEGEGTEWGPICWAIQRKITWFIEAVLSSGIEPETLGPILYPVYEEEAKQRQIPNCISIAIEERLDPKITLRLIDNVQIHCLASQDKRGFTPLHHAVEASRCGLYWPNVVKALISRGGEALDKFTDERDGSLSVYQYHMETRKPKATSLTGEGTNVRSMGPINRPDKRISQLRIDFEQSNSINTSAKPRDLPEKEKKKRLDTLYSDESHKIAPHQPNQGRAIVPAGTPSAKSEQTQIESAQPRDPAKEVARALKLRYMRSTRLPDEPWGQQTDQRWRTYNGCERFLLDSRGREYTQIRFEFPPNEMLASMSYARFKEHYAKNLTFDPVMLYVKFNQMVEHRTRPRRDGAGKTVLQKFFEWLYEEKHVRMIIKLIVLDMESPSHADEVIIRSLQKFRVDILDWRKIDLCPRVILEASKKWTHLHELHLRWSGSNAVLRAWSAKDGLGTIKSLQTIYIYQHGDSLDRKEYIDKRFQEFQERLDVVRNEGKSQRIRVLRPESEGTPPPIALSSTKPVRSPGPKAPINGHRWLEIMDEFSDWIRELSDRGLPDWPSDFMTAEHLPRQLRQGVTVALIDDGVDFVYDRFSSQMRGGKTFGSGYEVDWVPDLHYTSATHHGTLMAYMIARMCPAAQIYGFKMDVLQRGPGNPPNFDARVAADAVEHVAKQNFDIISMSWSIKQDDHKVDKDGKSSAKRIVDNLQSASEHALLFCSAPDIGHSEEYKDYYPYGAAHLGSIFRIGAARAAGTALQWSGTGASYILPGEEVTVRPDDKAFVENYESPRTGSLGAIYNTYQKQRGGVNAQTYECIKKYDLMRKVFDSISDSGPSPQRVAVEKFFKPDNYLATTTDMYPGSLTEEESNKKTLQKKWEAVAQLARVLVPYNMETSVAQR